MTDPTEHQCAIIESKILAALRHARKSGCVLAIGLTTITDAASGVHLYRLVKSRNRRGTFEWIVDQFNHEHSPPPKDVREHYALM